MKLGEYFRTKFHIIFFDPFVLSLSKYTNSLIFFKEFFKTIKKKKKPMVYFTQKSIFILFTFSYMTIVGHGFGPQTLIHLSNSSSETIHTLCLHALRNKISVASYDIHSHHLISKPVKIGKQSKTNCYIKLGFDTQRNNDILCTPTQEFYVASINTWVPSYKLKPGDALLTKSMTTKLVKHKEFVPKPLKIYMLEIQDSHTFFVGKYGILTHNVFLPAAVSLGFTVPFGSVATGAAGSFLGPIGLIGGIVLGGVASVAIKAIYENRIHSYKIPEYNISFIQSHCNNTTSNVETSNIPTPGCFNPGETEEKIYTHIIPAEYSVAQSPIGCIEIEIHDQRSSSTHCYDTSDENQEINPQGCFQPIEQNEKQLFEKQETTIESEKPKTRYQGEKARNWDEFEKNCHMGQKYGKYFIHTGKRNPKDGAPIRQLKADIPNTEMFKKNRFFAIDKFHQDHFEVWDKNEKWVGVANLDGSENIKKTNAVHDKHKRRLPN